VRKLFRYRAAQDRGEQEEELDAWPALVDVLAAAFVFMLIAFIGMLVREFGLNARLAATAAEEGQLVAAQVACARARAAHDKSMEAWSNSVVEAAEEATRTYAAAIGMRLREAGVSEGAAAAFERGCFVTRSDVDAVVGPSSGPSRREVVLICAVPSGRYGPNWLMNFQLNQSDPEYLPGFKQAMRAVVTDALAGSCTAANSPAAGKGCTAGFEVAGHADCTGTDAGNRYWELSTNRAGAVIQDLMTNVLVDKARADVQFTIQASGYETRVAANRDCSCDRADWRGQTACLANNRRIELRFRIRTRVLPAAPTRPDCKEVRP
jgi:hypothetical protein